MHSNTQQSPWYQVGAILFLFSLVRVTVHSLKSLRKKIFYPKDAYIIVKTQKISHFVYQRVLNPGSICGLIRRHGLGEKENIYLSTSRVMPLNKLYGLCHILPSTPSAHSGRRSRLRHICYKPQRLIITILPSPTINWGSEMCKSRRETCLA